MQLSIDNYICLPFSFFLHVSSLFFCPLRLSHSAKVVWKLLCPAVCPTLLHNSKLGRHNTNIAGRSGSLALNQIKTLQVLTSQTSLLLSRCLINDFYLCGFEVSCLQQDNELDDRFRELQLFQCNASNVNNTLLVSHFVPQRSSEHVIILFHMESCGSSNIFL